MSPDSPSPGKALGAEGSVLPRQERELLAKILDYQQSPSSTNYAALAAALAPVRGYVMRHIGHTLGDPEDALAAVHLALLEVVAAYDTTRWRRRVVPRLIGDVLDALKPLYRRGAARLTRERLTGSSAPFCGASNLPERFGNSQERLERAVSQRMIAEVDRDLLLGRAEGHNARELAERLGLSHANARQRLSRAQKYLSEGRKRRAQRKQRKARSCSAPSLQETALRLEKLCSLRRKSE